MECNFSFFSSHALYEACFRVHIYSGPCLFNLKQIIFAFQVEFLRKYLLNETLSRRISKARAKHWPSLKRADRRPTNTASKVGGISSAPQSLASPVILAEPIHFCLLKSLQPSQMAIRSGAAFISIPRFQN